MYLFVSMDSRLCYLAQILQIMERNPDPAILPVMSVLKQVLTGKTVLSKVNVFEY